jgi:hypothetical protein
MSFLHTSCYSIIYFLAKTEYRTVHQPNQQQKPLSIKIGFATAAILSIRLR